MAFYTPLAGLTLNLVSAAMIAGTTSTYTTTVATAGIINGKFVTSLGTQTNTATPTTDANTGAAFPAIPINSCAAIVFGQNTAGTFKAVQGPIIATNAGVTTTVGSFIQAPQFPDLPDDFMPLAYTIVRVAPSGGTGFVLGTTSWTASSISATTFQNVGVLPNRPQIA